MSTISIVIRADNPTAMTKLLEDNGILSLQGGLLTREIGLLNYTAGEAPHIASGWFWMGHWANNEQGQARQQQLIQTLWQHYWTGAPIASVLGVPGYAEPTGADLIRHTRTRLQLNGGFPLSYKGETVWWHSNYQSRDQQTGLMIAGLVGVVKAMVSPQQWAAMTASPMRNPRTGQQQKWRMMSGGEVDLTVGLMFDLLIAAMGQEGAIDNAAQAAIAAGTAPDKVQWPPTYTEGA